MPKSKQVNTLLYQVKTQTHTASLGSLPQFSSVAQSCPTLCDPMNHSTPGLPVHHQPPEFAQIHVHRVSDAIQPSHPLLSPSLPAPNPSQHQSLFQRVNSIYFKNLLERNRTLHTDTETGDLGNISGVATRMTRIKYSSFGFSCKSS